MTREKNNHSDTDEILFLDENANEKNPVQDKKGVWKILIVDDEKDIHQVTKLVLSDLKFNNKSLEFLSAYSGEEAKKILQSNPDIALILLDVVMEENDAGLKLVKFIREELKNKLVRIILCTGQPGAAPQTKVVVDYDINDYKQKTDLTKENFHSSIILALRTFDALKELSKK
jgi:CheY-like chemotaxis protein